MRRALVCVLLVLLGCSSAPKDEFEIENWLEAPIRVRRPPGQAADPTANPGDPFYSTESASLTDFHCRKYDVLFQKVNLPALRECFTEEIRQKGVFYFKLVRGDQPKLVLDYDPDDIKENPKEVPPACIREIIPELPVPREVFFLSREQHENACYSARLDLESGQVLGIQHSFSEVAVEVQLPIPSPPETDEEMKRFLMGWILRPFFRSHGETSERSFLKAKYVPWKICERCFGDRIRQKYLEPGRGTWPK